MSTLNLPEPIAAYFAAESRPRSLARCFTAQAVVKDEGHTHTGVDAIKAWKAAASTHTRYTSRTVRSGAEGGSHVVRSSSRPAISLVARSIFTTAFASSAA